MLKKILSISGKPGLYKLVSHGKNMIIVESMINNKRMPAYARERIVSLGDIAIYCEDQEVPLGQVLDTIAKKYETKLLKVDDYKTDDQLADFFADILPNYDRERVHKNDIKKIISWYNLLVEAGVTDFTATDEEDKQSASDEQPASDE